MHLKAGSRVPAYCTAIGKLLLSALPDKQMHAYLAHLPLARLTAQTITSPKRRQSELARICEQGFSIDNQEGHVALLAVAVPLHASDGRVAAGLALHGPEARLPLRRALGIVPRLEQTAAEFSRILFGHARQRAGARSQIGQRD